MKFRSIVFAVIAGFASMASIIAYADEAKLAVPAVQAPKTDDTKLDARLSDAMKVTQDRLANLSKEEKEKLLDDLNHPDGKTIGQGMALFGKELGQGLGSAVKEAGTSFNEFANSGVGKITTFIIVWKLFGRSILWFIFILILLKGFGKVMSRLFGNFDDKGKLISYNLEVINKMDSSVIFAAFLIALGILAVCSLGAAFNF